MSDDRRVIKINTDSFKIPNTRKNRKPPSEAKIKVKSQVKEQNNATLKRKLMKFIRNQHDRKMKELEPDNTLVTNGFNTEFTQSLDYLSKMTKHTANVANRTLKSYGPLPKINIMSDLPALCSQPLSLPQQPLPIRPLSLPQLPLSLPQLPLSLPQQPLSLPLQPLSLPQLIPFDSRPKSSIKPPEYGCLKGGSLPLYRNLHNQTQKENHVPPPLRISDLSNPASIHHIKQITDRMNEIKAGKPMPNKQKRTVRRTYKTGRSKVFPKVSVLVSNRTIRNNITTKTQLLKQTPIGEVKKFLIKNGFIKVGSIAPNDVLRKMYESALLICGEVTNHNPEYLLYNFMNGPDQH